MTDETPLVPPPPQPQSVIARWIRRLGCLLMILVWVALMALPCLSLTLLVEKEIIISRGDLPENQIRIFLLDSPDNRGLGFSWGDISDGSEDEGEYCIITTVNYLLWEGTGDPVAYCSCYENAGGSWSWVTPGDHSDCVLPQ